MSHLPKLGRNEHGVLVQVPCDCPQCLQRGLAIALFVIAAGCASAVALLCWAVRL
jgi:hypothetical protein